MTTPQAPAPLPRRARAMLAAYREAHEIPPAIEDRIWSVVGADDAPEPAFDPLEAAAPPRAKGRARIIGWVGGSLAAAAVLLLAWRMGGWIAERREHASAPGEAVMQGDGKAGGQVQTQAPERATARSTEPSGEPSIEPSSTVTKPELPSPSGALEPTIAGAGPTSRPRRPGSEAGEPAASEPAASEPAASSTLAAEVALMSRARLELTKGHEVAALALMAEHARRFPSGVLAPERAAIETIAHCRQSTGNDPTRAAAFHRAHPRNPLADLVDDACGVPRRENRPRP